MQEASNPASLSIIFMPAGPSIRIWFRLEILICLLLECEDITEGHRQYLPSFVDMQLSCHRRVAGVAYRHVCVGLEDAADCSEFIWVCKCDKGPHALVKRFPLDGEALEAREWTMDTDKWTPGFKCLPHLLAPHSTCQHHRQKPH